jgi:ABC-type polysaccharide/polyol phosphate export permease
MRLRTRILFSNLNWFQVYNLVKSDIKTRYSRNLLGSIWAILDPFIYIIVISLIFKYSLKTPSINNAPYITFLIPGFIIYDFCSKALSQSVLSFKTYSYLLNNKNFNHLLLPNIQILSELFIHIGIIFISLIILKLNNIPFSVFWFQVIYYIISSYVLITGISLIFSSLYLFFSDVKILIDILLRLGFFITPIFWNLSALPHNVHFIFKLNPFYYLVTGYRNCFINSTGFWQQPALTLYFWSVSIILLAIGLYLYKRFQPHFADFV